MNDKDKKWNLPSKYYTKSFDYCDMFFIDTNFKHLSEDFIQQQLKDTIQGFKEILDGVHDDVPEQAFYMVGSIDEVLEKAKTVKND